MSHYSLAYLLAWLNAAAGVVAGAIAGAWTLHAAPSWVTGDVAGTCAIVVPVTVGIAAILPSVGRTPATRTTKYLNARIGYLPADIARKHPEPPPSP